jgi:cysteinyl-tRNA synthetase
MKIHNTLTRQIDELKTLENGAVKLYVCGLTVYSQPHIGNWVAYIYWDVLVRILMASGLQVEHVQNITDVGHLTSDEDAGEDKMLKSALKEGTTAWDVAEKYLGIADREAYETLGLLRPTHMPRATEFITDQIAFVQELEKKGYTYVIADGVYFDTSKLSDYGKLAKLDINGLQFGARVADTGKKNPTDFAVWKLSDPAEKRDMEWDSPWGKGFPGWHLECSVMAKELLGETIDIHTGGIDHIPIHHTNEIAQSESVTGKTLANIWMHANHIKVDGTKMSKSLGNIYTLHDIEEKGYDVRAFKLLVLSKHYRTEGNFTWEILEAAQNRLNNWRAASDLRWQQPESTNKLDLIGFLQNDLDTPGAVAAIDEYLETAEIPNTESLENIRDLLGIDLLGDDISGEQKELVKKREEARSSQDWKQSDEIRDQLQAQGITVRDTENGTIWSRA